MAFNPFAWFRKHQKVLFAGLTILVMFVFIGQFGRGDIFERALQWFGAGRAGGPVVAKLYGKGVHLGELEHRARTRKLASDYLFTTAWRTHPRVLRDLLDNELKSTTGENPLAGVRDIVSNVQKNSSFIAFAAMRGFPTDHILQTIQSDLSMLEKVATREKVKDDPERLALLRNVATTLGFQAWLSVRPQVTLLYTTRGIASPDFYFGGAARHEDLLDFKLWLHQADRLGIKLSDADVLREIVTEAAGYKVFGDNVGSFERQKDVLDFLRGNREFVNLTPRDLLNALRDEFRAVLAQGILVGQEPGVRAYRSLMGTTTNPAFGSPDEFYNYVRDQRTTLRVNMLAIPVESYLSKVTGAPSEEELRRRFDRYKDVEPSAAARDPGFKEPRRISVEYVVGSPESDHYRKIGTEQAAVVERLCDPKARLGTVLAAVTSPVLSRLIAAYDPIQAEYEKVLENDYPWFTGNRDNFRVQEERQRRLHLTSVMRPGVIAATKAALQGGNALTGLVSLYTAATAEEIRTSLRFNGAMLLGQADAQHLFGAAALASALMPPAVPRELVASQLIGGLRSELAQKELDRNLQTIRTELAKFRTRARGAADYLAKAVKDYHLTLHSMPSVQTREALIEEVRKKAAPALTGLREALGQRDRQERPDTFVDQLFQGSGAYEAQRVSSGEPRKDELLYWRSEDLPARERSYRDVRDEVMRAWRVERARQLARQEAEKLEAEINKQKLNAADATRLLREQKQGPLFELDNVAQLLPPREVLAGRQTEYRPYQVPEDKADVLPFPPADLPKRLLELKRPGEATVVVDQPARQFYVAVLQERNEPTMADFRSIYAGTPHSDTLYSRFLADTRTDFRRTVLEQLRKEAGEIDKDGRFKLAEEVRRSETIEVE